MEERRKNLYIWDKDASSPISVAMLPPRDLDSRMLQMIPIFPSVFLEETQRKEGKKATNRVATTLPGLQVTPVWPHKFAVVFQSRPVRLWYKNSRFVLSSALHGQKRDSMFRNKPDVLKANRPCEREGRDQEGKRNQKDMITHNSNERKERKKRKENE